MKDTDIVKDPELFILELIYNANQSDHESTRILSFVHKYINYFQVHKDLFYCFEMIDENRMRMKPISDLADDCLFTTTFCSKYLKVLHDRRAAPDPSYYNDMGKGAYFKIGYPDISYHWGFWQHYLYENLLVG